MSFSGFGISIIAQNLASAEFQKVAADAGAMAAQISSQRMSIQAENCVTPEINRIAEGAARVKAEVEGSPISLSFSPVDVPVIPPLDLSSFEDAKVTFGGVGVAAINMGEDVQASAGGFATLGKEAAATTISLTTVARSFTAVTSLGSAVIMLAGDFGMVDKESAKWARTVLGVITVISALIRLKSYMTVVTTGQTASIAINTTAETANASASIVTSIAHKIKAAATWLCVAAQNALNISHATFLALTGVGIGVIIGAAAAMAYFASQMNAATSGIKEFNAAAEEAPTRARGIQRAGEEAMYRRGVE
jgi:hypothetical protein